MRRWVRGYCLLEFLEAGAESDLFPFNDFLRKVFARDIAQRDFACFVGSALMDWNAGDIFYGRQLQIRQNEFNSEMVRVSL